MAHHSGTDSLRGKVRWEHPILPDIRCVFAASALETLPTAVLREVPSHFMLHDKRSLWLTNSDMYAKRELKPHLSENRVWFVETALKDL